MTNITMFDRQYPPEELAEGMAIHWAIMSGVCNSCQHLRRCERDDMFVMPPSAPCMVHKSEILREMEAITHGKD